MPEQETGEEKEVQTSGAAAETSTGQEETPAGSEDLRAELENLRKQVKDLERLKAQLQSKADKTAAELAKERRVLAEEIADLRRQISLLIPPEQQEEYQRRLEKAELEMYRQQEQLRRLRQHLADQYSVPVEVLEDLDNGQEMVARALEWLAEQAKQAKAQPAKAEKGEEGLEEKKEPTKPLSPVSGATAVPSRPITTDELEARAKEIMQKKGWRRSMWGRAVLQAQAELERERRGQTSRKSKV